MAAARDVRQPKDWMIKARQPDEVAESVKVTMKALKDYLGLTSGSRSDKLRAIGSEFGHMVSRNISSSDSVQKILEEVQVFWTQHGLGEMRILPEKPVTFSMRDCYDCMGVQSGETLCAFKEGFINAILNEKAPAIGTVRELECCGTGADNCKFTVTRFR